MNRPFPLNRRGSVPRSWIYLSVVLLGALAILLFLRSQPAAPDYTLGGNLFTTEASQVEGLLVTRGKARYRLDRLDSGVWSLSGALSDYVDQNVVAQLLNSLTQSTGGRLLPGSDPEDRRYEFNGPGAIRVTLFGEDGVTEQLAIGAVNPVTGAYYGSGAGRDACFPVTSGLQQILAAVPHNLQLKVLLPAVDQSTVTEIEVWRGDQKDLLQRWNQRWWLQMPAQGETGLGSWFRQYSAHYENRMARRHDQTWLLANDQTVRQIIYESTRIIVKEILLPDDAAPVRAAMKEEGPWRRVVLRGEGINPDPTDGHADQLELTFGMPFEESRIPALRRGAVVLTEPEAVVTVGEPRSHLLDSRALEFLVGVADSLLLNREGQLLMKAHRDKNPARPDERRKVRPVDFWLTDYPTQQDTDLDDRTHHGRSQNFLVNLERMPILQVLAPTEDSEVLKSRERLRLVLWFADGQPARGVATGEVVLELGFIDESRLPAGSPDLKPGEDGMDPVGLWRPDTGQLLQIPGFAITTARAWVR